MAQSSALAREIDAMRRCESALAGLDDKARSRVIRRMVEEYAENEWMELPARGGQRLPPLEVAALADPAVMAAVNADKAVPEGAGA